MTVKELIEKLKSFSMDNDVIVEDKMGVEFDFVIEEYFRGVFINLTKERANNE